MADKKCYTITQAAKLMGTKPHVLRYWEKEFRWLSPRKNSAGRRFYTEHDIELARLIDRLVHQEGYSIQGARRRIASLMTLSHEMQLPLNQVQDDLLRWLTRELTELKKMLESG